MPEAVSIVRWDRYQKKARRVEEGEFVITSAIIHDPKIVKLPERSRWHFIVLMALVSKMGNILPINEDELTELAGQPIELQPLLDASLIRVIDQKKLKQMEERRARDLETRLALGERTRAYWNNLGITPEWSRLTERQAGSIWARKEEHGEDAIPKLVQARAIRPFLAQQWRPRPSKVFEKSTAEKILAGDYRGFDVEFPRDAVAAQISADSRGVDYNRLDRDARRSILSEDLEHVMYRAALERVNLIGVSHDEKLRWYRRRFGFYPAQRKRKGKK